MKQQIKILAGSIVGSGMIAASAIGAVSAETKSATIGNSGIPRIVYRQDRQTAAAKVLNVSTASLKAARKAKTVDQLVSKAGLTKQTFRKVKAELTSELQASGYSQTQVTKAMKHHMHAIKQNVNTSKS